MAERVKGAIWLWACVIALPLGASAQVEDAFTDEFDAQVELSGSAQGDVQSQTEPQTDPQAQVQADVAGGERPPDRAAHDSWSTAGDEREAQRLRVQNTWLGPSGGIHVVDAGSGLPGTFRLQLGINFFQSSDFLLQGDENDYVGGNLSLSWSVTDFLELFGSVNNHANYNSLEDPELLQVLGDTLIGAKVYGAVTPFLTAGGDFRLAVLNTVGDIGPVLSGTSFGFRGNLSGDLRQLDDPFPLIARLSLDYFFDNSAKLIEDVEDARYQELGPERRERENEDEHLLRRVERFALGINRLDMFSIALGFELPLQVDEDFFVHPIAEWTLGIPVNRQDYSCLLVATNGGVGSPDSCLDIEGLAAMPSDLTLALRVFPPVRGLSASVGIDIGLSGTSTFVRELAANKPYDVLFTLAYAVDARDRQSVAAEPVTVVREVVKPPPPKPRVEGLVVDAQTGQPVPFATVRYPDLELTAQQADEEGRFVSYPLDPGEVRFEVLHVAYEGRVCLVQIPEPGETQAGPQPAAAQTPAPTPGAGGAPAPAAATPAPGAPGAPGASGAPAPAAVTPTPGAPGAGEAPAPAPQNTVQAGTTATGEEIRVPLRCELVPKPRNGSVRGQVLGSDGQGVSGAQVQLEGPSSHTLTTDATGQFAVVELPVGTYTARVDAEGYLLKMGQFEVKPGETAMPSLTLVPKPKEAQVELTTQEVRIRKQVFFKTSSAEISERSNELLSEVADVLLRNPQVKLVEIQGHTDNKGDPEYNRQLSQQRAESVMQWLINAGVSADRLTARGYGDTRPLVPNLTDRNRARNRRVQFVIREQE